MHANNELATVNRRLLEQVDSLNGRITNMRSELEAAIIARNLNGNRSEDYGELKLRLNEYIREIDRCIEMLNE